MCARGSFSKTGVEPCELCAVGHYQSYFNKKECSPCPAGKTTRGKGAVDSNECLGTLLRIRQAVIFKVCKTAWL